MLFYQLNQFPEDGERALMIQRTGLHIGNLQPVGLLSGLFIANLPFISQVAFVAHQDYLRCLPFLIQFIDPVINASERSFISEIEDQEHAVQIPIVNGTDSPVSLGSSGIPQLKLQRSSVLSLYVLLFELNTYGRSYSGNRFLHKLLKQARFANCTLAQQKYLAFNRLALFLTHFFIDYLCYKQISIYILLTQGKYQKQNIYRLLI